MGGYVTGASEWRGVWWRVWLISFPPTLAPPPCLPWTEGQGILTKHFVLWGGPTRPCSGARFSLEARGSRVFYGTPIHLSSSPLFSSSSPFPEVHRQRNAHRLFSSHFPNEECLGLQKNVGFVVIVIIIVLERSRVRN